ncbi:TIGR00730 family Rossman fold protein [Chloroflexota bacterium]
MPYEINELAKEESWRILRIMGELIEGFDRLSDVEPAVSIYGSARINTADKLYTQTEDIARRLGKKGFSIITGGGPGVMEAANKGAREAGAKSIGLNIALPEEQMTNAYTTRSLSFNYFFARKVMLVKYATAFIIMPGGLGTLDELTEILTLMQTNKIKPFPVILFQGEFWNGFLEWLQRAALTRGFISEEDSDLLRVCDDTDAVIEVVCKWYEAKELVGKKALAR